MCVARQREGEVENGWALAVVLASTSIHGSRHRLQVRVALVIRIVRIVGTYGLVSRASDAV